MKIFFDTEFIDNGKTVELISIGMIDEIGRTFYAENDECCHGDADEWVQKNVITKLKGGEYLHSRSAIADEIIHFVGLKPEFWGYFADYDWLVLCQLYGKMIEVPFSWPHLCMDVKQLSVMLNKPIFQPDSDDNHNALNDAIWTKDTYYKLIG